MKKHIIFLMALCVLSMKIQAGDYPPFELWNKTSKPIWFAVISTENNKSDDKIMSQPLAKLPAGSYAIAKDDLVDKNLFTHLLIVQDPNEKSVTVYTFKPNKYMWVRIKEAKGKLVFGPQTGPLHGLLGSTENGYILHENVTSDDYKTEKRTRSPEQQGMMIAKSGLLRPYRYVVGYMKNSD